MQSLTPAEFAQKWLRSSRTERAAAHEHFIDLCRLTGSPTPNEADPTGDSYAFEKGTEKTGGGGGFADVWKRGFFAWEYKGKQKDLRAAYQQLLQYREALESPPLLVVSDLNRFEVHTNFTNTPATTHRFALEDFIAAPERPLRILRAVMFDPDALHPRTTRAQLTAEAAEEFASLAERLRARRNPPQVVAHFLNKLLFCMFAEDAGLLPKNLMERLTTSSKGSGALFAEGLDTLFVKMSTKGGLFGADRIEWFNGGLFDGGGALALEREEIEIVERVAQLDWSQVEPAVFGTLFERGLDPDKRSQLGAHYTDRESILRLIEPVLLAPLRREFEQTKVQITELLTSGKRITARTSPDANPEKVLAAFLQRIRSMRVLDPACGSGNFLYVALQALKDLEREVILWGSLTLMKPMEFPQVGPQSVLGIELNPYAAELARVVIWIGEIQWMLQNGFAYSREPILRPLKSIECRDAILDLTHPDSPIAAHWPDADVIVGNPPFLGGKLLRSTLGDAYVDSLFSVYDGRVPREADLVVYWHEKARSMIESGQVRRVGLLATQAIRGGANRRVLERIKETGDLFVAWSDEPWVLDGASVHVSLIGYDDGSEREKTLDGRRVTRINANLTSGIDLTTVRRLSDNNGIAFMGDSKGGPFEITPSVAASMLAARNPDGRSNTDVVRPWVNGRDVLGRPRNMSIVDFGVDMIADEASLYEEPFEYVRRAVMPARTKNRRAAYAERWWLHVEPRSGMRNALDGLPRFIATTRHSKHRVFVWIPAGTIPDSALIVFASADDAFFGVLQSGVHEIWARALGTQVREADSGFRYTPTTTFETFPFPNLEADLDRSIAHAAQRLNELREGWMSPPAVEDGGLVLRTMTELYNQAPSWLTRAHEQLDRAVHEAYGWKYPLSHNDVLSRLFDLNEQQSQPEMLDDLSAGLKAVVRRNKTELAEADSVVEADASTTSH